jgi:hypothetical protein
MSIVFEKLLEKKLSAITENEDLIKPFGGDYDRQYAEDLLHHTIGPLTDNPVWVKKPWNSPNPEPDDYQPGGPAYSWTPEDIIYAFAGNPSKLFQGGADSPNHGRMGGAPMFRAARKVARKFGKDKDRDFIADLYANGFVPLTKMMKPGFDEGRSPFISYVIRSVVGAMEAGPGAEQSSLDVTADDRAKGKLGLRAAVKSTDPEQIRQAAEVVQGKYQTERSFDKDPDNPYGQYSSAYYQAMTAYADALESGDEDRIEAQQSQMNQLVQTIQDANSQIRGAASGMGQAITNKDRKTSIGIASMDNRKNDEASSLGDTMVGDDGQDSSLDPESINYVLDIALKHDLGALLSKDSKWSAMAAELGAKGGKLGGRMTVNELRYVIRSLGPLGSNYPGEGQMRANTNIPRDAKGWWAPGEDPEIEPMQNGGQWNSIWKRSGYAGMQPTAIANEMTQEVDEFTKLGIPTARQVKEKKDAKTGQVKVREVVSKVAISNTVKAARIKLQIVADIHKDQLGLGEGVGDKIPEGLFTDKIDREIVVETATRLADILQESLIQEATSAVPKKNINLLRKIMHELQKPSRPTQNDSQTPGTQRETGVTKALQYQDKMSKWASKFNEDDSAFEGIEEAIAGMAPEALMNASKYLRQLAQRAPRPRPQVKVDGKGQVHVSYQGQLGTFDIGGATTFLKRLATVEESGGGVPASGNSHKQVQTILGRPGGLENNDVMASESKWDQRLEALRKRRPDLKL